MGAKRASGTDGEPVRVAQAGRPARSGAVTHDLESQDPPLAGRAPGASSDGAGRGGPPPEGELPPEVCRALHCGARVASVSVTDALGLWICFERHGMGAASGGAVEEGAALALELSTGASLWFVLRAGTVTACFADHLDDPLPHCEPPELTALVGTELSSARMHGARLELCLGEMTLEVLGRSGQQTSTWEWLVGDTVYVRDAAGGRQEPLGGPAGTGAT